MARIRSIKPEFFDSPSTAECTPWARLLYIAMWCLADDWGVGPGNLKEMAAFAFPNDEQWTSKELPSLCKEVADHYQVVFYINSGRHYFEIPSWEDHQVTQRKAKRRNPVFDDHKSALDMGIHDNQGTSLSTQGKDGLGTGEQGNKEQGNRGTGDTPSPTGDDTHTPTRFAEFWDHYPRKVGKKTAATKYAAAAKRAPEQNIIDGARELAADPNLPEHQYIPYPTTWLERDGWEDEPQPVKRRTNSDERLAVGYDLVQRAKARGTQSHAFPTMELEQ